ncbi:hypothetical protein [Mucilaginibacter sp. UR6-11]|uniref:hypothetical protein n=1 Tax=Mucilaginibacter sp. UR6-11 TaxID=1435644 RepID=UPI001E3E32F9|nr:hypothetical protein [Mucilaginibacter sp. UR6-11]MCC8425216.1 hypothetical protein [Mucilaginibacter sp. UR6-11]
MAQTHTTRYTIRKWPIVILVIIFLLGGAGWYAYNRYFAGNKWKPLLQARLKEMILKSSDSLYHIEYSDFDLNLASGDATLSDFKLVPDSAIYQKLVAERKAPDNLFTLSVKKLTIKNVGAKKALNEKILIIDNITIDKPDLTIVNKRYSFNDTVKVGKPKTPYQLIKNIFKQLRIDSIALKDISVNYVNKNNPVTKQTALKHLDINISRVLIDSLSALDSNRFYYTKGIDFVLHDYKIATPDSLYSARLGQVYFSTAKREIILDNVSFTPRYNRTDFYKKLGTSGDIFTLNFKKIAITDIDLQRFLRDQKLYAGIMDVANANVQIYSNSNYKGKKSIKIGKDPQQALQKVALDMKLGKLNLTHSDIIYSELDAITQQTGVITFNNTTGHFFNVTNDDDVKKKDPFMIARISTHFMNAAPLQVNFKFNLNAKDGAFNYSGSLGRFDGRILDKLVKPLALVHVKSADIERLNFNVNASNYAGKGHLEFYYKNLNVELLKKVDGQAKLQTQGLISKIANSLIIDNDNPDSKGNFRAGPINLKREPTVSFFSFLYKGLLDGLKPSVGFTKKTEGTVNKVVTKVTTLVDKFNKFKSDRKERKLERQARRQAKKDSIANLKKQ